MPKDSISDEDKALFRAYVEDVIPLDKEKAKTQKKHRPSIPLKEYFLSDYISMPVFAESVLAYSISGVSSKQFQDLKQGRLSLDAKLDLHGLNIDMARTSLCQFIQLQFQQGKRCLLIVHGKGGRHGEPPWLKNLVNRWLPQFDELAAFHSAQARDGGLGAVYVLLKKNREYLRS